MEFDDHLMVHRHERNITSVQVIQLPATSPPLPPLTIKLNITKL